VKFKDIDKEIIKDFIERGVYTFEEEVISAALRALVREQAALEDEAANHAPKLSSEDYSIQLDDTQIMSTKDDYEDEPEGWF
jgi:hypothetical protein